MAQRVKIAEDLVQRGEECSDCLTRQLFNVNMRLFNANKSYRTIINDICNYMEMVINREYVDYSKLSGLSGANVGIPYNIISVRMKKLIMHMINPSITRASKTSKKLKSNCGSLNLPAPLLVSRRDWVDVSYYDTDGNHQSKRFILNNSGGTIQHEIDHNRGVLITDTDKHL